MATDPYKYFRVEAQELLDNLSADVLALERQATAERVSSLLRHAHTLKGAARVVKQRAIADVAHEIEELLDPLRSGSAPLPIGRVDALLKQLDAIPPLLAAIQLIAPPPANRTVPPQLEAAEPARTLRTDVNEVGVVVEGVTAALSELGSLRALIGKLDEVRRLADHCTRQLAAARRLDARIPDRPLEQARALSESMSRSCRDLESQLTAPLDRALRELEAVRGRAEQLRLSPTNGMFAFLERAAHDASEELGKQLRVETRGGDIRLDGSVLEVVQRALLHVVRNAVAHGIESPQARLAAGKPAAGLVEIEVRRHGRRVAFSCQDDGAGIDSVAVRDALVKAGKLAPEIVELASAELYDQLLRAGVSTTSSVTGISGRGIGLDVLREAAEQLGGTLRLDSQRGRGLLVELLVPLSIASVDALAVESVGQIASLPLEAVSRSIRLEQSDVALTAAGPSVIHEGQVIPFLSLARALGRPEQALTRDGQLTAVILRSALGAVALGVDRVVGTKTVVLRRLPALLPSSPLVAGATLDALGHPELVLDAETLYAEAQRRWGAPSEPAPALPVLIVDDSPTTRILEQSILESAGYTVALATCAEEALIMARTTQYSLFLCDVEMPGMDGFGFVEHIQRDAALRHIPSVLVSSRDTPEDIARGHEVGALGYVVKGRFDQRELLALIGKLLGR